MRYMEDPGQSELFDFFDQILSPLAYPKLRSGWQHLFRCAILKLMPAKKLADHFHPEIGRPTKSLWSFETGRTIKRPSLVCSHRSAVRVGLTAGKPKRMPLRVRTICHTVS